MLNANMQIQPLAVGIPNLLLSEKLGRYGQDLDCCVPLSFVLLFLKAPETVRDTPPDERSPQPDPSWLLLCF